MGARHRRPRDTGVHHRGLTRRARTAFARVCPDPAALSTFSDLRTAAELALAEPAPDPDRALDLALRGAELFERGVAALLRDTDRVAACDSVDLAALFVAATKACVSLAARADADREARLATSYWCTERARSLAVVPRSVQAPSGSDEKREIREWREAAAAWTTDTDRLLLSYDEPHADVETLVARADMSERRLRTAELRQEERRPGWLLGRRGAGSSLTLPEVQAGLPSGAALLEFHSLGHDLTIAAVTADHVQVVARPSLSRELAALVRDFHQRCEPGHGHGEYARSEQNHPFAQVPPDAAGTVVQTVSTRDRQIAAVAIGRQEG